MKIAKVPAASLALAVLLQGCATQIATNPNARPSLVDPARTDMAAYGRDYGECAALANQTDAGQSAGSGAAGGAVAGAIVGVLIGAVIGHALNDTSAGMRYGAAIGGVEGGTAGAAGAYGAARVGEALPGFAGGAGYGRATVLEVKRVDGPLAAASGSGSWPWRSGS